MSPCRAWPADESGRNPESAVEAFVDAVARRAAELAAEMVMQRLDGALDVAAPFITYAEAAEIARVHQRTIRARVAAGQLTRHALSPARPLIERAELLALMADGGTLVDRRARRAARPVKIDASLTREWPGGAPTPRAVTPREMSP